MGFDTIEINLVLNFHGSNTETWKGSKPKKQTHETNTTKLRKKSITENTNKQKTTEYT